MKITDDEANEILLEDIRKTEAGVNKLLKVELSQCQYDAVIRFVFNIGTTKFAKSTMLRYINAKQFDKVPAEFLRWVHAGGKVLTGLVTRRHSEAKMWQGIYPHPGRVNAGPMPQEVDAPKKKLSATVTHALPTGSIITLAPKVHELFPAMHLTPDVIRGLEWSGMFGLIFALGCVTTYALLSIGKEKPQESKNASPSDPV